MSVVWSTTKLLWKHKWSFGWSTSPPESNNKILIMKYHHQHKYKLSYFDRWSMCMVKKCHLMRTLRWFGKTKFAKFIIKIFLRWFCFATIRAPVSHATGTTLCLHLVYIFLHIKINNTFWKNILANTVAEVEGLQRNTHIVKLWIALVTKCLFNIWNCRDLTSRAAKIICQVFWSYYLKSQKNMEFFGQFQWCA